MEDHKTLFRKVDWTVDGLLHYIDMGTIALPDIQRPFVWPATKVRDLFDSMYRGFPVGYLLFWENMEDNNARMIGSKEKGHLIPSLLIVDGQQRLTSLYSVMKGKQIIDQSFRPTQIQVAFRPRDGKFEVPDAAIARDPEFIPNISSVWTKNNSSFELITAFLKELKNRHTVDQEEENTIAQNLDRLFDLRNYPFTSLEIFSSVDEEEVADIFVRINSEGVKLNQADFILTLMSVFREEDRVELESFCRDSHFPPTMGIPSSFNFFIQPSPDQLLRVAVALGFYRARLKSVYQLLRGKNIETGEYDPARRGQQFDTLREAQTTALDITNWHQFFGCLLGAGFYSRELISSEIALIFAYSMYLIGKKRFKIPEYDLQKLIGRWFLATSLTGRYSGSPETMMESDLNRLKPLSMAEEFRQTLEEIIQSTLTHDFWTITLPHELGTSSARSPELYAFYAAQTKLDAPLLFSSKKLSNLLNPALALKKKALDRHHLFPRAYLESLGIKDMKTINQAANFALLEWPDDIAISDAPPMEYVPRMQQRFSPETWKQMCELNALPDGWEMMDYEEFLNQRRYLMAQIIRRGYGTLT
jgi:hypothetical protein